MGIRHRVWGPLEVPTGGSVARATGFARRGASRPALIWLAGTASTARRPGVRDQLLTAGVALHCYDFRSLQAAETHAPQLCPRKSETPHEASGRLQGRCRDMMTAGHTLGAAPVARRGEPGGAPELFPVFMYDKTGPQSGRTPPRLSSPRAAQVLASEGGCFEAVGRGRYRNIRTLNRV